MFEVFSFLVNVISKENVMLNLFQHLLIRQIPKQVRNDEKNQFGIISNLLVMLSQLTLSIVEVKYNKQMKHSAIGNLSFFLPNSFETK